MSQEQRKYFVGSVFAITGIILLLRLFYVQIVADKYKLDSENNVLRYNTIYPSRGLIYDRNGTLVVHNEAAFDLMIVPKQLNEFDTLKFCNLLDIEKKDVIERISKAKNYSRYKPSLFLSQISAQEYAQIQEELYLFDGFYMQSRSLRKYPYGNSAHIFGHIGEVDKKLIESNSYYKQGDYIGQSGIEKSYEENLRGRRGVQLIMVDVFNREMGSFEDGKYDSASVPGNNLILTIDQELQDYGERLMQNKRGSIVAIEPATGEILALVSSPYFDPNVLVGRRRNQNYPKLVSDTNKPLFNRALMAKYPPGSTFKLINALIGLQEGVIDENTRFSCYGGYNSGSFHMGCHAHASPVNFEYSIQTSCNAYYSNVFRATIDAQPSAEEGYNNWRKYVMQFGVGNPLEIDLPNELSGFVPESSYYDKYYRKGGWNSLTVVSLAIGQGELGITPLQMANISTIIANRGYYIKPHLVKLIDNRQPENRPLQLDSHIIDIDKVHFERLCSAMQKVVDKGTGYLARIDSLEVCGKTGTVENPHGDDHSTFLAFAPRENPKIALSVYVENGVWGSRWAAPIAGLMIEKYLRDTITRSDLETRMLNGNLIPKVEKPEEHISAN